MSFKLGLGWRIVIFGIISGCQVDPNAPIYAPPGDGSIQATLTPEKPRIGQPAKIEGSGAWKGIATIWLCKPGSQMIAPELQTEIVKLGEVRISGSKWYYEFNLMSKYETMSGGSDFSVTAGSSYTFVVRDSESKIWGHQFNVSQE